MAMNSLQLLLLISSTLVLLLAPESRVAFQATIFGGTVVAFHMFYRLMKYPHLLRLGNIACFSILFGYVVSTAGYTILNLIKYGDVSYNHNEFGLSYSQSNLSIALLVALIASIILSAISHFEKPILLTHFIKNGFSRRSLWVTVFSTFLIVIGVLSGDIGYMGVYLENEGRISPFGAICFIMAPPLAAITIAFLLKSFLQSRKYRTVLLPVSAVLVLALVPFGRRVLMYSLMTTLIFIGPEIFENFRKKRIQVYHAVAIAMALCVFLAWGFRAFYAIRISIYKMAAEEKPPILDIVPYYFDLMKNSYALAEVHEKLIDNISERPFILSYLAGLLSAHTHRSTPVFGELRYALAMSVPSFLYPEKTSKMASASEEIVHTSLGLSVFDGPNTIITAGLNDLWMIGMVIYPVGIIVLYILICRIIPAYCPPFLSSFIVLRLIYTLLYFEESLGALVGSGLRDLFIVSLIYWIVLKIPVFRFHIGRIRRAHE